MPIFDLVAVGDATKDVFVEIEEASVSCTLHTDACLLCLNYADKIPVKNVTQIPAAGNAANAAVGTARLGHKTALVTTLGNDSDGRDLAEALKRDGVSSQYTTIDKKHGTNYSTVLNFKGERTILVYHQPRTYVFPKKFPNTKWVYYTSIGKKHEAYERMLLAWLKAHPNTKLLFQPGTHQLRRGLTSLLPVMKRSSVFVVNKEEAQVLLGDGDDVTKLLIALHNKGPEYVVITDGANGSWGYHHGEIWKLPMFPGKAKERTGAGDAFATGLVNALIAGKPLDEAMRWGTANSRGVVLQVGPQAGLLTAAQMKTDLKKFARITPRRIS
ncbi:MAG: hypothetical protein RL141_1137 [Candidatus Parcubacteria bacterium]|jgi:ribokinase